jgi:hypothetical protein
MHEWLSAEQTKDLFCVAAGAGQWRQPWKCLACRQMQRDGACLLNNLPPCHASPRPGLDLTLIVRYYHSPGSGWAQPSAGVGTDLPVAIETTSSHSSNGLAQKYSSQTVGMWRLARAGRRPIVGIWQGHQSPSVVRIISEVCSGLTCQ